MENTFVSRHSLWTVMHVECGARFLRVSTLPPMPGLLHHESFSFALAKLLLETGELPGKYG